MKMVKRSVPLLLLPFLLTSCITRTLPPNVARNPGARQLQSYSSETTAAEPANSAASWPRVVSSTGTTNLVYEPKVDSWDGYHLVARDAVEIQGAPGLEPAFGVVTIRGTTLVNKNDRTVELSHIEITGGDFPSAKSHEYVDLARKSFPKELAGLSLDHLRNSFNGSVQPSARASEPLNNTAPKIIFSTKPAVLVLIDGPPIYRPVEGADLQRAVNTRMLVLKDKSGSVYVRVLDGYMEAPAIDGRGKWPAMPRPAPLRPKNRLAEAPTRRNFWRHPPKARPILPLHRHSLQARPIFTSLPSLPNWSCSRDSRISRRSKERTSCMPPIQAATYSSC
jgi:hypothetical protein